MLNLRMSYNANRGGPSWLFGVENVLINFVFNSTDNFRNALSNVILFAIIKELLVFIEIHLAGAHRAYSSLGF